MHVPWDYIMAEGFSPETLSAKGLFVVGAQKSALIMLVTVESNHVI